MAAQRSATSPADPAVASRAGWRRVLALRPELVSFPGRGFADGPARAHLEACAGAFLAGFNAELEVVPPAAASIEHLPESRRGFAAEGAAMAAALLDQLNPRGGRRLAAVHDAHDERHEYLLHVGTGWALAKLRRRRLGRLGAQAPLLRWLALDGRGFCVAFFQTERQLAGWRRPQPHDGCPPACSISYQGYGRHLWFRECASPDGVARRIAQLPAAHRADAWSGAGLAATYAGGAARPVLGELRRLAGPDGASVGQGAAFGAEARRRSGVIPPHTYDAVDELVGVAPETAADWTWQARHGLDRPGATADDFRRWRDRIRVRVARAER